MSKKTLTAVEQKEVLFYDDEVTAVRTNDNIVYIPVRPICERLGVDWPSQYRRINRDEVLKAEMKNVSITVIEGDREVGRPVSCLPLDYISGFLFGINASRVKAEYKERVLRYQRECYKVLADAFAERRLTGDPAFAELLQQDSEAVEAYKMLQAMVKIARQQILIEARLDTYDGRLIDHENRIETIEAQFGDETRTVSEDQASQISQAVKAIALTVGKRTGRNEYGGVYGELYRKFGVTSYKLLPASQFPDAMKFLTGWHQSVVDTDTLF